MKFTKKEVNWLENIIGSGLDNYELADKEDKLTRNRVWKKLRKEKTSHKTVEVNKK